MDSERIRQLAENLEQKLVSHMEDDDVRKLHGSLVELVQTGRQGLINSPVDNVPGAYWFLEGGCQNFLIWKWLITSLKMLLLWAIVRSMKI